MIKFHADAFFVLASVLEVRTVPPKEIRGELITNPESQIETFQTVIDHCQRIGLPFSAMYAKRIIEAFESGNFTYGRLSEMSLILQDRIKDESGSRLFLQIPMDKVKHYESLALFGAEVEANFAAASLDIEEAGKCYACNRSTACVMHLARVIEIGLKAVRAGLKLPPLPAGKQTNWGDILRQIWDEIGIRNKASDPTWMGQEKPFYENVHADLSSVKNAWRNPSMHADRSYDPERAEDIFNMTKSFMRHLAQHLDESGTFTP
jgi:hypothetical protein